jgi:phage gp29-like protein
MGFVDKLYASVKAFQNFDKPQPQKASVIKTIPFEQQLQRVRQDAKKYKIALTAAESPYYPNRFLLYQMYQEIVLDAQVQSAMLQRKGAILSLKFNLIGADGVVNEEKTKLLNQKWLQEFINYALDSIFWGHSLVQFGAVKNSQFDEVELVPRIYVVPEFDLVRENIATVTDGVNFTELPYSNWCIGVGGKKNLGLLLQCAPYATWKRNAMGAWAEFAEVFGSPIRVTKTDVRDETTRKNAENMMRNMGAATWSVLDLNDEFEIVANGQSDSFNVFDKMVERCNSEISKIILGQTGTTDEKSYSGSAQVHKDVLKMINKQDMLNMEFVINNQLLPMCNKVGFDFTGLRFEFDRSENVSIQDKAKIDASFMPYVKYDAEYLENTYKIEVEEMIEESQSNEAIKNKLKDLYS